MGRRKLEINSLCGDRIRQLCETKKITQAELAKSTGYTSHTISQVVTGKKGLSYELANAIVEKYPDVSRDWLMGDPNASMDEFETFRTAFEDIIKKCHFLDDLLTYMDYNIDCENPYVIEGFNDDEFFKLSFQGKSVLISDNQLTNLINTIVDVVNSLLKSAFENGMTAEQLVGQCSDFAEYYLDDWCDALLNSDLNDSEKRCIANFVPQAIKFIGSRNYASLKHPGESESEHLKKYDDEFKNEQNEEKE